MKRVLLFVSLWLLIDSAGAVAQQSSPAAVLRASPVTVTVPNDETELVVEGKPIPGAGATRTFNTPPLDSAITYVYTFIATFRPNTYTTMTRTKLVTFKPGDRVSVDLTVSNPNDRVLVRYVPTPEDIVEQMVKLAGVSAADVVYEPGCGDARITIAAVKAGAKRGVGIDIDPDRVFDSQAAVKAAGLADKIEIRLGDALDIRDLSEATVVFLYMGDHFNLLMRPALVRQLKVGTRIVSHRFKMGDWEPDKTVMTSSGDSFEYELHLWTVTEAIKRRLQ